MHIDNVDHFIRSVPAMFNWFDCQVLAMVVLGGRVGKKYGFSAELGVCLQWVSILIAGAFLYQPFGDSLSQSLKFSRLFCYMVGYIVAALVVKFVFSLLKKGAGGKLM